MSYQRARAPTHTEADRESDEDYGSSKKGKAKKGASESAKGKAKRKGSKRARSDDESGGSDDDDDDRRPSKRAGKIPKKGKKDGPSKGRSAYILYSMVGVGRLRHNEVWLCQW